jgi:hypothetical protein
MRRIDVLAITLGVFLGGGVLYLVFRGLGIEGLSAGVWAQSLLMLGLMGWISTYLFRVATHKMTLNQQLDDYQRAVLQKRYESLSPEEQAALVAEVEAERQRRNA